MRHQKLTAFALALLCSPAAATEADGFFRSITFDEARTFAARDGRWILLDFYTTWCMPCKLLDQTTLADRRVRKWIADKCVALKIDAERQVAMATRYDVEVFPTLLLCHQDGTQFERISGYVSADDLLKIVHEVDKGVTSLSRRKALADVSAAVDVVREVATQLGRAALDPAQRRFALAQSASYYEVLLSVGRQDDARRVAEMVLQFDDGAEAYHALAWAACLSGRPTDTNIEQASRALELAGGQSASILDTLFRLMHRLGKTRQAIDGCRQALDAARTEEDKALLGQCLEDLRAQVTW